MAKQPSTAARDAVRGTVPQLIEYTEKVVYGDVWERPGLSKRDRSLVTVAALIALYRSDQLKGHLQRALFNGVTKDELAEAITKVRDADGLIVVTPVFAASYSGLFKMFFDVLEEGVLDGTPVLVAATAGTARHSLVLEHALRPLFVYLHAVVVPTGVFAATDDFGDTGLDRRIERAAGELAALMGKVDPTARRRRTVDDEFAEPTPFEELLRRAELA